MFFQSFFIYSTKSFLVLFLFLFSLPYHMSINKFLIPNPMSSPEKCGREGVPKSAICDTHNLLKSSDKDVLEGKINQITGYEVGIAIIDRMTTPSEDESIEDLSKQYAVYLHNTWGVGDKHKQNGILLFLSIIDRAIYISRGSGLSNELNSIVIDLLIAHMRPYLQEGNYGKALEAVLIEIDLLINDSENSQLKSTADKQEFFQKIVYFFVTCFVISVMYLAYRQHVYEENLKKGEKALSRLLKDVTNENENKFRFTSCPICLEEFHYPPNFNNMEEVREEGNENKSPSYEMEMPGMFLSLSCGPPPPPSFLTPFSLPGQNLQDTPITPSTPSTPSSTDPLRPMALHCGHTFCYSCLETYLKDRKNGKKCPICRLPVDPAAPVPPPQPSSNNPSNSAYPPPPHSSSSSSSRQSPSSSSPDYDPTDCHNRMNSTSNETRFRYHSPEYMYRMNRMRYLYPSVMTADTYERMNRGILNQSATEIIQAAQVRRDEVTRQLSDIQLRRAQQSSGSSGSSRSWGGGGSSGGGGGGRW